MPTKEELLQALLDTMSDMGEADAWARFMFYGESGTGKTVLSMRVAHAILPESGKILYLDYDQGFTTLTNPRWRHLTEKTTRMRYAGLSQLESVAQAIQARVPAFADYKVLVLDESSSFADAELGNVVKARAAKDPSKDPDEAKLPDMGVAGVRFKRAIAMLNGCDVHIIQIAHVRKDKDNLQIEVTSPNFMPKLGSALRETAQLVGYVTADLNEGIDIATGEADKYLRWIQVQPSRRIVAKTRIDMPKVKMSPEELVALLGDWAKVPKLVKESSVLIPDTDDSIADTDDPAIISED